MVIWLLGISGAGKSTLGNLLSEELKIRKIPSYLIDGDEVRSFFESDLGYSKEERIANIKRIIFGSYVLSRAGIFTIVCNISPFEELRNFCRRKIPNYFQVYLKKSIDQSIRSDVKEVYKRNIGKTNIVGMDLQFEEPTENDLVLEIDSLSIDQAIKFILTQLQLKGYLH